MCITSNIAFKNAYLYLSMYHKAYILVVYLCLLMVVIKLSKSGRAFQVIADDGTVYQTSLFTTRKLLDGQVNGGFIVLTEFPNKCSADRFPKSPMYKPEGDVLTTDDTLTTTNDVFSGKYKQANEEKEQFKDKSVW